MLFGREFRVQGAEQSMDCIDAMKVFVAALDEGSLAGAARKLGCSAVGHSQSSVPLVNQDCGCRSLV
jgi:hypothetical protein